MSIEEVITPIINWSREEIKNDNAVLTLQNQLLDLWKFCISFEPEFDDEDYEDAPSFDLNSITAMITKNFSSFPSLSIYNIPIDITYNIMTTEMGAASVYDDLSDIIRDLLEVEWRLKNTSENDAGWYLDFSFKSHFGVHISSLMQYLTYIPYEADSREG